MDTDKRTKVRDWIDDLQRMGRITFTLKEVYEQFPSRNETAIKNTLTRFDGGSKREEHTALLSQIHGICCRKASCTKGVFTEYGAENAR